MLNNELNQREDIREHVKQKYGDFAAKALSGSPSSCCGTDACCGSETKSEGCCSNAEDPITSNLYSEVEVADIPAEAILSSLGCGNPTALAELGEGETVLDLGCGGGIDVLLAAKQVGGSGFAIGVDMTDQMLALANVNRVKSGIENVKFLKGHIEEIPLPDSSVDVVISNCVINLSPDKLKVLQEAYRVLKPGGRLAVSDIVVQGEIPEEYRSDMELYVGCIAGALENKEYLRLLALAGFSDISIEPTRRYKFSIMEGAWAPNGVENLTDEQREFLDGRIMSGFIRGTKTL